MKVDAYSYWHVELDQHDVLVAEGLPAESYIDIGDRGFFADAGDAVILHPAFSTFTWDARACAPLTVTGPNVDKVRATLAQRVASPRPTSHLRSA